MESLPVLLYEIKGDEDAAQYREGERDAWVRKTVIGKVKKEINTGGTFESEGPALVHKSRAVRPQGAQHR